MTLPYKDMGVDIHDFIIHTPLTKQWQCVPFCSS